MNYRTNEDKLGVTGLNNYNLLLNAEDLSEDSGPVIEPVLLQEVKDYLRLEGFNSDNAGVVVQEPITLTLLEGALTVSSALLSGKVIVSLTREGAAFTQDTAPGNKKFSFSGTTITFNTTGNAGGEEIGIVYGTATDNATADNFDYDDALIESMITEGRMWVEKQTGIHLVPKRLEITFCNGLGYFQLPGPVQGAITLSDGTGVYIGTQFPKVKEPVSNELTATYAAGYNYGTVPEWAKNAIKAYVADHYEYRGDDAPPAANKRAAQICHPHKRGSAWA